MKILGRRAGREYGISEEKKAQDSLAWPSPAVLGDFAWLSMKLLFQQLLIFKNDGNFFLFLGWGEWWGVGGEWWGVGGVVGATYTAVNTMYANVINTHTKSNSMLLPRCIQ